MIEIEVTDKGQEHPNYVRALIVDSLAEHFGRCIAADLDRSNFPLDDLTFPRVRVLTEDNPL